MPRRLPPHCAHASHFVKCRCQHERQVHEDEEGPCMQRRCICLSFQLAPGQMDIQHETLPDSNPAQQKIKQEGR